MRTFLKLAGAALFGAVLGTAILGFASPGTLVTIIDSAGNAAGVTAGALQVNCTAGCSGSASTSTAINDGTTTTQKAGVGANGALSVQGVAGGTAVPVSGTVTATNPSVGTTGAAVPASATQIGVSDGTNLQPARGDTTNGMFVNVKTSVLPTGAALEAGGNLATIAGWNAAGQNVANPAKEAIFGCAFDSAPSAITTGNVGQVHCDSLGYTINDFSKLNGSSVLANAGATGAGSQRVTTAQDTTTIAGSAPGTAGAASANVVTVQGIASMTKLLVTPDSVALPANQSVNVNQIGGSAVSTAATGTQKVGITGNTGAAMDAAGQNAASPANELLTGCQFVTAPTTITTTNMSPVQCDNAGDTLVKVNVALPTGANTIGAVTQASGPWTSNVTQFGGTNISTGTGAGGTGIPRVTISNDSSLAANQSVNLAQVNGVTALTGAGAVGTGSARVAVGQDTTTIAGSAPGTSASPSANIVSAGLEPVQSGGLSVCFLQAANSSNATNCKASAGQVYHITVTNNGTAIAYLRLYNLSSAPTCTSATGLQDEVMVPAPAAGGGGIVEDIAQGEAFGTGIGFCFSGGIASTDNTSVAANTFLIKVLFK